ncbi:MAG: hypothetical protein HYZ37_06715 [Candidatus Solibacter usitatus]|nr:hypothetical protein [Candidatus Solibacter usitatus]
MNVISKPNLFEAARATKNAQVIEKAARWYGRFFNLGSYRLICGSSRRY